jgi:hypothetical protein
MKRKIIVVLIIIGFVFLTAQNVFAIKTNNEIKTSWPGDYDTVELSGYVTDSETGAGIEDAEVTVRADDFWWLGPISTHTSSNGYYQMDIPIPDDSPTITYIIKIHNQDYRAYKDEAFTILKPFEESYEYDAELIFLPYKLSGRVTDLDRGIGIENVKIYIDKIQGSTTYTNDNGYYSLKFDVNWPYQPWRDREVFFYKSGYKIESIKFEMVEPTTEYELDCELEFEGFAPYKPEILSYPEEIFRGENYEIQVSCTDPEEDKIEFQFQWDETAEAPSDYCGPYTSGATIGMSHIWHNWNDMVKLRVRARDTTNKVGEWSDAIEIPMINLGPEAPSTPEAPSRIQIGKEYSLYTKSVDPEEDPLYYCFDWGDGTDSGWLGPYNSDKKI